jgi:AcrR family transcriptional regulator
MTQDRAVRTREAILAAAVEEFSSEGYAGARIDAIAQRSRANKQRIYAYFGNKESLFRAVQADALAKLIACEEAVLERAEAEPQRLTAHLRDGYITFHRDHPEFRRILAWANLAGIGPEGGSADHRAAVLKRLKKVFQRAQTCGGAPAGTEFSPWLIAVTAIIYFIFSNQRTASVNLGMSLSDPKVHDELVRSAIDLLGPPQPRERQA